MNTATIYARVPEGTKDAAHAYAAKRDLPLTAALSELITAGLDALEAGSATRVGQLEEQVARLTQTVQEQALSWQRAEDELATLRRAATVWARQADLEVATCPGCHEPLTSADLLVGGQCSNCNASTSALIEPAAPAVNGRDFMYALGAAGLLLGLLALSSKSGGGGGMS